MDKNMTPFHKTLLVYLFGCIGLRTLLVLVAKNTPLDYLPYLGYLALLPAIGFMYIYWTGSREKGIFGQHAWWNSFRPIHSIFYFLFAYNAIRQKANAWIYLLADVVFGLVTFILFHFFGVRA